MRIFTPIVCIATVALTSTAGAQFLELSYVETPAGVTGTLTGQAPYTSPDPMALPPETFSNGTYADVGPGNFGAGGTLTTFVPTISFVGDYSPDLSTLVNPLNFTDPTSVSGPLVYVSEFVGSTTFVQLEGQVGGDAINSTIFFAGETLASLGITAGGPTTVTFTPVNTTDFAAFDFTVEASVIPEPATLALLSVGGLALLLRRVNR